MTERLAERMVNYAKACGWLPPADDARPGEVHLLVTRAAWRFDPEQWSAIVGDVDLPALLEPHREQLRQEGLPPFVAVAVPWASLRPFCPVDARVIVGCTVNRSSGLPCVACGKYGAIAFTIEEG